MAKRTVINRAAKMYINTSDDSDLLTGSINTVTANEYEDEPERKDVTPESTADKLVQGFKKEQAQIHEEEKQAAEKATEQPEQEPVKESKQDGNQEADGQTDIFDYIEDDQTDEK